MVVFRPSDGFTDRPITVPCGQCIGCRLERSRQWALRCVHEASLHTRNCFITLTYDDDHLPNDLSLNIDHFQKFMKRLRKRFGDGIRFFHCGEYGENFGRPHYHACLFNFDFPDRQLWTCRQGVNLYTSAILQELWPFGFSTVGDVTFESAAYVARYVMKKITGKNSADHYSFVHPVNGNTYVRSPEYITMSRRPGIGREWLSKYLSDVYPYDHVVVNGVPCRPPRYYDNVYDVLHPSNCSQIKADRLKKARIPSCDNSLRRLKVREEVQSSRLTQLKRTLS